MRPARTEPARRLLQPHRLLRFGPEVPSLEPRGSIREWPLPEAANRNSRRTGPAKRTQPQCPENAERMLPRQAPTPPMLLSATTPRSGSSYGGMVFRVNFDKGGLLRAPPRRSSLRRSNSGVAANLVATLP